MNELDPHDLMFEITPPPRRASASTVEKNLEKISAALQRLPCIRYVNIPEVIEENREGKPFYRNMDNRDFGKTVTVRTGKEIIVNKVTPHLHSLAAFDAWLSESIENYGMKNFVFVGGSNASVPYPGPSVIQANSSASSRNVSFGNICIPSRKDEAQRLLAKTRSKCGFFTTQVLFEMENMKKAALEYDKLCRQENLKPAMIYLSFSPLSDLYDLEFSKWLGAIVPEELERRLRSSGTELTSDSIELASSLFSDFAGFCRENSISVPFSANIEPLTLHNLEPAIELTERIRLEKFS